MVMTRLLAGWRWLAHFLHPVDENPNTTSPTKSDLFEVFMSAVVPQLPDEIQSAPAK